MRSLAVLGRGFRQAGSLRSVVLGDIRTVTIDGHPVDVAMVRGELPEFDRDSAAVLVRKTAFSCNYRDKALILSMALNGPAERCLSVGSDFVGVVEQVGARVTGLSVGDRVVPDASYGEPGRSQGVPTNRASLELQVLPAERLVKVPAGVSDDAAASITVCGQTVYGMIRRLEPRPGMKVLVTAGRSNVALFAVEALRRHGVDVYVITTSGGLSDRLRPRGVLRVFEVGRSGEPREIPEEFQRFFDRVLDAFGDVYLAKVLPLMAMGARYASCGVARQFPHLGPEVGDPTALRDIMPSLVLSNLEILGNCLGRTRDLEQVLADTAAGKFEVPVDSVWSDGQIDRFLERTFCDPDRFGKVVCRYGA